MGVVEVTIKEVLSNLDTPPTYLRASKLEEANVELSQIDTSSAVAIYYNLPIIVAEMVHGRPVEVHPVKISFVKKAGLDNTGIADDTIRDAMEILAAEFYDSLVVNYSDTFEKFDGYTLDPVSMDKPFDEKMVGFSLEFDIKYMRGVPAKSLLIQSVWSGTGNAGKITFTADNRLELLTFIDVLLMNELTDGATVVIDCNSEDQIMFFLSTAQGTPTFDIQNFGNVASITVKKTIAGDTVVTLSGTGLKFVDLDSDNETIVATTDLTLSAAQNSHFEISLIDSGFNDGGSDVLYVISKK